MNVSERPWSKEEIVKEVTRLDEIQPWWHDIELPYGVFTRGRAPAKWDNNHNVPKWQKLSTFVPPGLQRAIDLGCNEGYFCLKLRELGIPDVVGVDISPQRIEKAHLVMNLCGETNVRLVEASVYELAPLRLGTFDLALCLGLVHRVPDPYGLLAAISELADTAILEWSAVLSDEPVMRFWGGGFKTYDVYNSGYWQPSRSCVREILQRYGFSYFHDIDGESDRATLLASRNPLAQ